MISLIHDQGMKLVHHDHVEQVPQVGTGICGVVYVLDVALDKGVGAGDTFLIKWELAPFIGDDPDVVLKPFQVSFVVHFFRQVTPLANSGGVICVFVGEEFVDLGTSGGDYKDDHFWNVVFGVAVHEAVGDDQSISWLQPLKKGRKSGPFHALSAERFGDNLLTAAGFQRSGLVLQAVAVNALACGGDSGVSVNHCFSS